MDFVESSQEEAGVDRGLGPPRKCFIFFMAVFICASQLRAILKPGRNGQPFPGMVRMFGSAQTQDGELRVNDLDM